MITNRKDIVSTGATITVNFDFKQPLRLVSVEMFEKTAAGLLVHGYFWAGILTSVGVFQTLKETPHRLLWQGSVKVVSPQMLSVNFKLPASGNICSVLYTTAALSESVTLMTPERSVVATCPFGKLKLIRLTGVATQQYLDFVPTVGYTWRVIDLWGYHDDVVAANLFWRYFDGVTDIDKEVVAAVAATIRVTASTNSSNSTLMPSSLSGALFLTAPHAISFRADAPLSAGKKLYVQGVVAEYANSDAA